jgi:hypothetical protein
MLLSITKLTHKCCYYYYTMDPKQAVAAETQQLRETLAAKAAALEEVKQRQKDMSRLATSRTRDEARLKGTANTTSTAVVLLTVRWMCCCMHQ